MYESRAPGSRISIKTKLWFSIVKVLSGWNKPKLYSFQGALPKLPLPSVNDTMQRVIYFLIYFIYKPLSLIQILCDNVIDNHPNLVFLFLQIYSTVFFSIAPQKWISVSNQGKWNKEKYVYYGYHALFTKIQKTTIIFKIHINYLKS